MESPRGDEVTGRASGVGFASRGCRLEGASLGAVLDRGEHPRLVWAGEGETIAAHGSAAVVTAEGGDRFADVRAAADELFTGRDVAGELPRAARPRLFGGFAFHDGDQQAGDGSPWAGFPDAAFVLPAVQVTAVDGETWLTATATGPDDAVAAAKRRRERWRDRLTADAETATDRPTIVDRRPTPDREGWRRQVEDALDQVERGSLRKVVLAQALTLDLSGPPPVPSLLESLGETYPDCRRFLFAPDDGAAFFGVTPERLVSLRGRTVRTEALAGSTGRGETPAEDQWLAEQLRDSPKDAHEHDLVVEAIREQLTPFASSVRGGERSIRRLATVQHLRTPMTAELAGDEHVLALVEALHPTPAVGGLPPDAALATIRETETFDRGWYAAPVGWFDADGNGSFAVAIRSALARGETATLFAGAGIVADSDPDAEWDEVQLKYRPILDELA
ncbi:MAG: isochorismate synthase MenF [Haloarculaceae archaeon]